MSRMRSALLRYAATPYIVPSYIMLHLHAPTPYIVPSHMLHATYCYTLHRTSYMLHATCSLPASLEHAAHI